MKQGLVQLTLREMRGHFSDRRTWLGLAIATIVIGLSGPFGTFEALSPAPRLIYWAAVVVVTYAAGYLAGTVIGEISPIRNPWLRAVVHGAAVGLPVWLSVVLIQVLTFGPRGADGVATATLWLYCTLISMTIFAAEAVLLAARPAGTAEASKAAPPAPPLLDRLPRALRGELHYLSMQDHYVEVATERGRELVLLRLADAIRETEGVDGVQIHRSHWVARKAVRRALRSDGRVLLEMPDGVKLPVSRGFLAEVRAKGLLD